MNYKEALKILEESDSLEQAARIIAARESEGGEADNDPLIQDYARCLNLLGVKLDVDDDLPLCLGDMLDEMLSTPQPDKWIPCGERLPTEDDGFIWVYSTHTKAVLWRPQTWRDINMWTEREKCLWMPANLRKPAPPEQESE